MPSSNIDMILEQLDREGLENVRKKATWFLKQKAGSLKSQPLEQEDWILEGIKTELDRRGLLSPTDAFRIKNSRSFAGFQTKSEKVRWLLEQAAPELSLIERKYLGEIAAQTLARYIESWYPKPGEEKVMVSLYTMLRFVDYIPRAIETAFPGYMASRVLGIIITHKIKQME
jgi:hypothetical protein